MGLAYEFLYCLELALGNIQDFPEMHAEYHNEFRRCMIRRFPYSIFYTNENEIVVHAVFDNRQDPKKITRMSV